MTNPVGNQTKYHSGIVDQINDYIDNYKELGHVIPSVVGAAEAIDVTSRTIQRWAKDPKKKD